MTQFPDDPTNALWASAWRAADAGDYNEAISIWTGLLDEKPDLPVFGNRGITYLLAGDFENARRDFEAVRAYPPATRTVEFLGVTLWLSGDYEAACRDWNHEIERRKAKEIVHGGVQPPTLLWWASAHPGLEHWRKPAEAELRRRWRTQYAKYYWPGPIAGFLLGKITEEKVSEWMPSEYPRVQAERLCEYHFYVGAKRLAEHDDEAYRACMINTQSQGSLVFSEEYLLARFELANFPSQSPAGVS